MLCLAPWQYRQCLNGSARPNPPWWNLFQDEKGFADALASTNNYNIFGRRIPQDYMWSFRIWMYACCNQWHASQSVDQSFVKGLEWNIHSTGSYRPGRSPQVMRLCWASYNTMLHCVHGEEICMLKDKGRIHASKCGPFFACQDLCIYH